MDAIVTDGYITHWVRIKLIHDFGPQEAWKRVFHCEHFAGEQSLRDEVFCLNGISSKFLELICSQYIILWTRLQIILHPTSRWQILNSQYSKPKKKIYVWVYVWLLRNISFQGNKVTVSPRNSNMVTDGCHDSR